MTDHPPLTELQVRLLAEVLDTRGKKIALVSDDADGTVRYGHARYLCGPNLGFITATDVRDAHMRVTLQSGYEVAYPIADLVDAAREHRYRRYDW